MAGPFVINPVNRNNDYSHSWLKTDGMDQQQLAASLGLGNFTYQQEDPTGTFKTYSMEVDPAKMAEQRKALADYISSERDRLAKMAQEQGANFNVSNTKDYFNDLNGILATYDDQIAKYNAKQQQHADAVNQALGIQLQPQQTAQPASTSTGVLASDANKKATTTTAAPASSSSSTSSATTTTDGGPYSTMTPIQFAQFAPSQVLGKPVLDERLAYKDGQATRQYQYENGNPYNMTNNPYFNNGSDPTHSSWSGLNMGLDHPLNMFQQMTLARIMGKGLQDMNAFNAAQTQHNIQDTVNDPRMWQATKQLLEQGVPLQEAQYAAMSQLLDHKGQYGALNMVAPQYAEQAAQRQGNQGALAGMFGMDYEAQPNLFGINSPITSIHTNGDTTAVQLGNARYNIANDQVPHFMRQIAALPNGPQVLRTLLATNNGMSLQDKLAYLAAQAQYKMEQDNNRSENRKAEISHKADVKESKNSNVVGSSSF
jgi:hypothetical protein